MNITTILTTLQEEMAIDKYREKAKSVPTEVMDKLASIMKRGKFDNTAMAIMKVIQNMKDGERKDYLIKHPVAVYTIIRKTKKGNDNYDPNYILKDYAYSDHSFSPREYWKLALYDVSNHPQDHSKKEYGLKNAIVKRVGNEFLIFPKTFKEINELGLSDDNLERQWRELKAISDELAKKDTSGEDGANVNHWCVASSDNAYYEGYKKRGGIFIVIVKAGKDGKPDYNRRYLLYLAKSEYDDDENNIEFADKFDNHLELQEVLSEPTEIFTDKILKQISNPKDKGKKEAKRRINKALEDEWDDDSRTKGDDAQALKKLIDLCNEWIDKHKITLGDVAKELRKLPLDSEQSLENYIKSKSDGVEGFRMGNFLIQVRDYLGQKNALLIKDADTDDVLLRCYCDGDYEIMLAYMKKAINPRRSSMVLGNGGYERINQDRLNFIFPFKTDSSKLRGNRNIARATDRERNETVQKTLTLLPGKLIVRRNNNKGKYEVHAIVEHINGWPRDVYICDLKDGDMLNKVRDYLYSDKLKEDDDEEDWS